MTYPLHRFSSVALAAALTLSTLISARSSPLVVFWSEALAAGLVVIALLLQTPMRRGSARVSAGQITLIAIAGSTLFLANGAFAAYLLVFASASLVLALHASPGFVWVAIGLLLGACLQALAGFAQLGGHELGGVVLQKVYRQAFGNVGQANHFAALISLGISALLVVRPNANPLKLMGWGIALVSLAFAIAASASRAPWFYMLAFIVLGAWSLRSDDAGTREAGRRAIWIGLVVLMVQVAFAYGGFLDKLGVTSSIARAADAGSNGQRLYDWALAWSAIKAHPWLGVGIGGFHGWAIEQMPFTPPVPFSKFAEHAHNLPLHLAATMGVPFTVLFLGGFGWWLLRQLRAPMTPERLFAFCGLSVIGLHSMVEYPLWYTYFIIPAGLFCGILAATNPAERMITVPAWLMRGFAALMLIGLVWVARDYVIVERAYADWYAHRAAPTLADRARVKAAVEQVPRWSIVADHAQSMALQTWLPDAATAPDMVSRCEPAFKQRPSWGLGTQCLLAMAMAGDRVGLERMSLVMCEGFARHHALLREWADGAQRYKPALPLRSFACLRNP